MSVLGEFHRLVADCVATLRSSGATDAGPWVAALENACGHDDLERAAARVLEIVDASPGAPGPVFASELEREAFERRRDHLSALCRVILGR